MIADLQERGIKFQTHVIGFDLNPEERKALERISMIGNGNYYDARNLGELLRSLDQFARDAKVAGPPEPPVYLNETENALVAAEGGNAVVGLIRSRV